MLVAEHTKFGSDDQKFGCLNPHHFLVGVIKIENPARLMIIIIDSFNFLKF